MPLKNPTTIPKIPKTRKKKANAAIKAIPSLKPDKLEYVCNASFKFDDSSQSVVPTITIETIAEFTSFSYEITMDIVREKREIFIILMGLRAKTNVVPTVQPAIAELPFEDLIGEYDVSIVKQDGAINTAVFKFNSFTKEIELLKEFLPPKKNNRLFTKFTVIASS